jgi:hypothetical protein
MTPPTTPPTNPDPTTPRPYASIEDAKAAGAGGTDDEIANALVWSGWAIDQYTRTVWSERPMTASVYVSDGWGRIPVWCSVALTGTLDPDGHGWWADDPFLPTGEYQVEVVAGPPNTPPAINRASARLAAQMSPLPFTAEADAEGNPIGRPPAPARSDLTDPGPPTGRQGEANDRTTGDPTVDAWLEPYKVNRVMLS